MTSLLDQPLPYQDPNVIFPLMICLGPESGLTFYTFPKHHLSPEKEVRQLYSTKIKMLEDLSKSRELTQQEQRELAGLKHNLQFDPRNRNVCYGTLLDTKYGIEVAIYLDADPISTYLDTNEYLADWHICYPFESTCTIDTPEILDIITQIVERKRTPMRKPHYSDYHFIKDYKIELLPGDQIGEKFDVLTKGDHLLVVTRAVGKDTFSKWALRDSLDGLQAYKSPNVSESLSELISDLNRSYLVFMGNPEDAPIGGTMMLAIYILDNTLTYAQVGPISLKHKVDKHFETLTEDHTFDNPSERERTKIGSIVEHVHALAKEFDMKLEGFIYDDEAKYLLVPKVSSRFIGHPHYNRIDELLEGNELISAKPFIKTITLGEK